MYPIKVTQSLLQEFAQQREISSLQLFVRSRHKLTSAFVDIEVDVKDDEFIDLSNKNLGGVRFIGSMRSDFTFADLRGANFARCAIGEEASFEGSAIDQDFAPPGLSEWQRKQISEAKALTTIASASTEPKSMSDEEFDASLTKSRLAASSERELDRIAARLYERARSSRSDLKLDEQNFNEHIDGFRRVFCMKDFLSIGARGAVSALIRSKTAIDFNSLSTEQDAKSRADVMKRYLAATSRQPELSKTDYEAAVRAKLTGIDARMSPLLPNQWSQASPDRRKQLCLLGIKMLTDLTQNPILVQAITGKDAANFENVVEVIKLSLRHKGEITAEILDRPENALFFQTRLSDRLFELGSLEALMPESCTLSARCAVAYGVLTGARSQAISSMAALSDEVINAYKSLQTTSQSTAQQEQQQGTTSIWPRLRRITQVALPISPLLLTIPAILSAVSLGAVPLAISLVTVFGTTAVTAYRFARKSSSTPVRMRNKRVKRTPAIEWRRGAQTPSVIVNQSGLREFAAQTEIKSLETFVRSRLGVPPHQSVAITAVFERAQSPLALQNRDLANVKFAGEIHADLSGCNLWGVTFGSASLTKQSRIEGIAVDQPFALLGMSDEQVADVKEDALLSSVASARSVAILAELTDEQFDAVITRARVDGSISAEEIDAQLEQRVLNSPMSSMPGMSDYGRESRSAFSDPEIRKLAGKQLCLSDLKLTGIDPDLIARKSEQRLERMARLLEQCKGRSHATPAKFRFSEAIPVFVSPYQKSGWSSIDPQNVAAIARRRQLQLEGAAALAKLVAGSAASGTSAISGLSGFSPIGTVLTSLLAGATTAHLSGPYIEAELKSVLEKDENQWILNSQLGDRFLEIGLAAQCLPDTTTTLAALSSFALGMFTGSKKLMLPAGIVGISAGLDLASLYSSMRTERAKLFGDRRDPEDVAAASRGPDISRVFGLALGSSISAALISAVSPFLFSAAALATFGALPAITIVAGGSAAIVASVAYAAKYVERRQNGTSISLSASKSKTRAPEWIKWDSEAISPTLTISAAGLEAFAAQNSNRSLGDFIRAQTKLSPTQALNITANFSGKVIDLKGKTIGEDIRIVGSDLARAPAASPLVSTILPTLFSPYEKSGWPFPAGDQAIARRKQLQIQGAQALARIAIDLTGGSAIGTFVPSPLSAPVTAMLATIGIDALSSKSVEKLVSDKLSGAESQWIFDTQLGDRLLELGLARQCLPSTELTATALTPFVLGVYQRSPSLFLPASVLALDTARDLTNLYKGLSTELSKPFESRAIPEVVAKNSRVWRSSTIYGIALGIASASAAFQIAYPLLAITGALGTLTGVVPTLLILGSVTTATVLGSIYVARRLIGNEQSKAAHRSIGKDQRVPSVGLAQWKENAHGPVISIDHAGLEAFSASSEKSLQEFVRKQMRVPSFQSIKIEAVFSSQSLDLRGKDLSGCALRGTLAANLGKANLRGVSAQDLKIESGASFVGAVLDPDCGIKGVTPQQTQEIVEAVALSKIASSEKFPQSFTDLTLRDMSDQEFDCAITRMRLEQGPSCYRTIADAVCTRAGSKLPGGVSFDPTSGIHEWNDSVEFIGKDLCLADLSVEKSSLADLKNLSERANLARLSEMRGAMTEFQRVAFTPVSLFGRVSGAVESAYRALQSVAGDKLSGIESLRASLSPYEASDWPAPNPADDEAVRRRREAQIKGAALIARAAASVPGALTVGASSAFGQNPCTVMTHMMMAAIGTDTVVGESIESFVHGQLQKPSNAWIFDTQLGDRLLELGLAAERFPPRKEALVALASTFILGPLSYASLGAMAYGVGSDAMQLCSMFSKEKKKSFLDRARPEAISARMPKHTSLTSTILGSALAVSALSTSFSFIAPIMSVGVAFGPIGVAVSIAAIAAIAVGTGVGLMVLKRKASKMFATTPSAEEPKSVSRTIEGERKVGPRERQLAISSEPPSIRSRANDQARL